MGEMTKTNNETEKESRCEYPNCQEHSISSCDFCDAYFCADHGTRGKRLSTVWGSVYASLCWKCEAQNADE